MKNFSNKEIIGIVEEFKTSSTPEDIIKKYDLTISIIKNWIKLIDRGRIRKDNKCLIHNTEFRKGTANIKYGRVILSSKYRNDSVDFPNSNTFKIIGRKTSRTSPKIIDINYCPKCRELENEWVSLNGNIFGS